MSRKEVQVFCVRAFEGKKGRESLNLLLQISGDAVGSSAGRLRLRRG